ncbi:MAG: hypothetical protein Q9187_002127 [Circinaria calcarea]
MEDAFKNNSSLSYDGFIEDMMIAIGTKPIAVSMMFQDPTGIGHNMLSPNPQQKSLARLTVDFHKQQLLPGENLDRLGTKFLHSLDTSLRWGAIEEKYVLCSTRQEKTISLFSWCADVLIIASTHVFFGERLLLIEPDLPRYFLDFDNHGWKLIYHYPRLLSKELFAAKTKMVHAMSTYFRLPKDERLGETWFVRTLEAEQRALGMTEDDIAALMLLIYWGVNANTFKICFWIIAYLLHNEELLCLIRSETAPAFSNDQIDLEYLLQRCPYLEATFYEVLRLTAASASVRTVVSPTEIGGKVLRSGKRVIIPYRQLHCNQDAFGEDVYTFSPERFMNNKDLIRSPSFRPFGGGSNYCPGRFIARQEVSIFIALILYRFDIALATTDGAPGTSPGLPQKFPRLAEWKPSLGVMAPEGGDDVILSVKQSTR